MKIRFLKDHLTYKAGELEEAREGAANYLIRVGVAEEVKIETFTLEEEPEFVEKVEHKPAKEKKENKTGNVPTAKKKKK